MWVEARLKDRHGNNQIETNNRPDVTCDDIRQHKDVSMAQQL